MKNNNFKLTLSMLAEMCNVSEGTVDRALHNRDGIKKETKEKILKVAREHGYIDCIEEEPKLIGVVVFDLYNNYFSEFLMNFESECAKNGFSMVVMFTDKDCDAECRCIKQLYYMGVKGIVLCPINSGDNFEGFLKSIKIPVVTVGNRLSDFSHIGIDDFMAAYDAAKVLNQKSEKIIYYSPALSDARNKTAQQTRYEGFVKYAVENNADYKVVRSFDELTSVLDKGDDWAILCSTDSYMIQVMLKYPKFTVMGIDGVKVFKDSNPKLISVDTNIKIVAEKCLEYFIFGEKEDVTIPYSIRE